MMRSILLLAAFAIHAAALLSHATAGDAPVTVKVRLDRDSYLPGEPILLLLDFQYHGDKVCYRNPDEAQRQEMANLDGGTEHDLTAVLKGPGGYVRTWRPRYRSYEPLGWTNPSFPMWPHERTRQTIILSRVFQPSARGDYQLDWILNVPIEELRDQFAAEPEQRFQVKTKGTAKLRVVAANRVALEKRADALLAEAQRTKNVDVASLSFLATMPPDIAIPRFRRFFDLKHASKNTGKFAYAAHALTYVDTKEAVDLIADVNKWTYQFNNRRPGRFDKGRTIYGDSIQALQNMYYMTNKPEIERHVIKAMGGVAPHLLRKLDKRQKEPNIPST